MPVSSDTASASEETADDEAQQGLPVNELFYSLQGEGKLAGTPSVFVRTSGCNLRCWFCDSYHTSWEPTHAWHSIDAIVDRVTDYDQAEHVVLTGGEPLLHDKSVELLNRLSDADYHTTVETNGTIFHETAIDLVSISPKLASSTPTREKDPKGDGDWAERHKNRRINIEALCRFVESYEFQLKFVITDRDDMPEINSLVDRLRESTTTAVRASDILLMPEGTTRGELAETRQLTAEVAMEYGYQYTPRLHVDLWNDAPET